VGQTCTQGPPVSTAGIAFGGGALGVGVVSWPLARVSSSTKLLVCLARPSTVCREASEMCMSQPVSHDSHARPCFSLYTAVDFCPVLATHHPTAARQHPVVLLTE
jgi:hypothetical protein